MVRGLGFGVWGRKAQIKTFETIAVLAVFFFLLITGSIIYFNIQKTTLQKETTTATQQYALQIAIKTLHMPELDCTFLTTQKENCIDKLKLNKLKMTPEEYYTEYGYTTITVKEIYPKQQTWTPYNNPQQGEKITTITPILLYDQLQQSYSFGTIEVNVYV